MLNFCPLCVAEVYALRCDAVFLYLQNLYFSTLKRCIRMGIPSLNSAIFYNVGLYFLFTDPSLSLRMTNQALQRQDVLFFNTTYIAGLRRVCLPAWRCKYRSQIQTIRIHSITYSRSPIHPGNGIPYCLIGT